MSKFFGFNDASFHEQFGEIIFVGKHRDAIQVMGLRVGRKNYQTIEADAQDGELRQECQPATLENVCKSCEMLRSAQRFLD